MTARGGWTLAEMVVVAAILAVLVGLTVPVVSSVMNVVRRTACQSNLRQIGMAFTLYATDHQQRLPAEGNLGITDPARSPAWFYRLPPYLDTKTVGDAHTVFQCPAYHGDTSGTFSDATPKSYKMNSYLDNKGRAKHYRCGQWEGESDIVLMIDAVATDTGMGQWGHCPFTAVDGSRHGGACILMLDCRTLMTASPPSDVPNGWKDALRWLPFNWPL